MSSINLSGIGQGLSQFVQNLTSSNISSSSSMAGNLSQMLTGMHPHHQAGNSQLFQQIQQAVTTALQQGQASGAPGTSSTNDPNQTIEAAIAQVLNGNASTTSSATASGTPGTFAQTTAQSFMQALQSNGVTPEQFRNDLLAAVQQTGNEGNLGQLAANLPPGMLVDAWG